MNRYQCSVGAMLIALLALPVQSQTLQARGILRSLHQATLSSELAAQIQAIPYKEGMKFKRGNTLIQFDCSLPRSELTAAQEQVKIKQSVLQANQELSQFESIGQLDLLRSQAEFDQAKAEANSQSIRVQHCQITAPFTGMVQKLFVAPFEVASAGQELVSIVDPQSLQINLLVPSDWLNWVKLNQSFAFSVDETKTTIHAKIQRILPQVDAVSKTVHLIGAIDNKQSLEKLRPGMSGLASFEINEKK